MNKAASSGKKPIKYDIERTKKIRIILIILFALLGAFSFMIGIYHPLVEIPKQPEVRDFKATSYFPLQQGNSWSYIYTRQIANSRGKVREKSGRIVMEVKKTYSRPNYFMAVMHGDPVRCDPAADYAYLVASNKVFLIPEESLSSFETAAQESKDLPGVELESDQGYPLFEMPMFVGLRWGPAMSLYRNDGQLSSKVSRETYVQLGSKKKSPIVKCYQIVHRTAADKSEILFSPGLGIVKATYKLSSPLDSFEVRLSGYKFKEKK